jgi:hypothetical protein
MHEYRGQLRTAQHRDVGGQANKPPQVCVLPSLGTCIRRLIRLLRANNETH